MSAARATIPLWLLVCALSGACREAPHDSAPRHGSERKKRLPTAPASSVASAAPRPSPLPVPAPASAGPAGSVHGSGSAEAAPGTGARATGSLGSPDRDDGPEVSTPPFIVDEPTEVGPSGPATASALGVLMNDREGTLFLARLGPLSRARQRSPTPVTPLPGGAGRFGLGRGPGILEKHAYWISHGALVRQRLSAEGPLGRLEVLARDAFDGTRVGTPISPLQLARPLAPIPATVAYVVRPPKEGAPLSARLWTEGAASELLTAEGNSTHSVSLVRTEEGVLAISVQARMAMTPVHARAVHFVGGKPKIGEDLVAWVGGGVQPLAEMTLVPLGDRRLFGYLPHEKSTQEFGLAELDLGTRPDMDTPTSWLLYRNGIDPAPVAAGALCGDPVLFHAEPRTRAADSGQELIARPLSRAGAVRFRIAEARAFYFISFSTLPGGGLVVWVADDGTTRAATLRCQNGAK